MNMDLLRLTPYELQHSQRGVGSGLQRTRDIWEETELFGIRIRAGGAAFSQTEVLGKATVPFMGPPPPKHCQQKGALSETPLIWLILFASLW